MNRRQKTVVSVVTMIGLIAYYFKPTNLYWNTTDNPPIQTWGPPYLWVQLPAPDVLIEETRWGILLVEFAVIVLLTGVLTYKLKGEDVPVTSWSVWALDGGGKWDKKNRLWLWFLVYLSILLLGFWALLNTN